MHDIRAIRANPEILKAAMLRRHKPEEAAKVEEIVSLDAQWRKLVAEKEALLARRNAASKEIGQAMAAKDAARAEALKAEVAAGKERLAVLEAESAEFEAKIRDKLAAIPNIPHEDVPEGADEHANVDYVGRPRNDIPGSSAPRPAKRREQGPDHVSLGEALGMMDFESAAKLSGSRFVVLKKGLAKLERALGAFMLDLHTSEHGYTEVNPPILVRDEAMYGTAQLPKFRDDQFFAGRIRDDKELGRLANSAAAREAKRILDEWLDDEFPDRDRSKSFSVLRNAGEFFPPGLNPEAINKFEQAVFEGLPVEERHWLIPTAEVPLTNLVREKILSEEELPLRFTALTPCFRAEAGSAGRDTRGMLRQHQFNKVELVSIATPETSRDEHERMLSAAETVLKRLGLHFRTMTLSTGDMGFASQKTYDIEVWLPGQNTYREISSCSVCGDFQARRMEARYRPSGQKETRFVHTLNGSGVAVGRALIAVMENYQNEDGSIAVPDVLVGYMGGLKRIERG